LYFVHFKKIKELRRLLKLPLWQLPPAKDGKPLDMNYVSNYIKGILGKNALKTLHEIFILLIP
jgi:hypothetical protein